MDSFLPELKDLLCIHTPRYLWSKSGGLVSDRERPTKITNKLHLCSIKHGQITVSALWRRCVKAFLKQSTWEFAFWNWHSQTTLARLFPKSELTGKHPQVFFCWLSAEDIGQLQMKPNKDMGFSLYVQLWHELKMRNPRSSHWEHL